jgi:hypothetical protein
LAVAASTWTFVNDGHWEERTLRVLRLVMDGCATSRADYSAAKCATWARNEHSYTFGKVIRLHGRDHASRQATRPDQSVVVNLDCCVTFARGLAEAIEIGDLDMPPAVMDVIGLLQRIGHL